MAHDRTVEEIQAIIGCDALIYQDVDAMKKVLREPVSYTHLTLPTKA